MFVQRDVRQEGRPRALLVALDDPFGLAIAAQLEKLGWAVDRVRCGRDALSRWSELDPMVVVVDLDGGDMDAFDFLHGVGERGRRASMVACARSAALLEADGLRDLGIDLLVTRPCRADRLANAVAEMGHTVDVAVARSA